MRQLKRQHSAGGLMRKSVLTMPDPLYNLIPSSGTFTDPNSNNPMANTAPGLGGYVVPQLTKGK